LSNENEGLEVNYGITNMMFRVLRQTHNGKY